MARLARARRVLVSEYAKALAGVTDPLEVLRTAATVWFSTVEHDPERWMLLFGTGIPLTDSLGRSVEQTRARTPTTTARRSRDGPARTWHRTTLAAAAQMVASMGSQLAQWWLANRHISRNDIVDYYTQFCWNGLRPLMPEGDG